MEQSPPSEANSHSASQEHSCHKWEKSEPTKYEGVSKSFRTESITKCKLTFGITR